jgi:hypothetical protein
MTKEKENREVYRQKVEAELEELEARISLLIAKAKKSSAAARIEAKNKMRRVKNTYEKAEGRIEDLQTDSKLAWEEVQKGVEEAIHELRNSVEDAIEQFS